MIKAIEHKAPKGKFRVVGVDTFDGTDWITGDFDTIQQAVTMAEAKSGNMLKQYIYNDEGKYLRDFGTF